jgi:hypothetical protein
MKKNRIKTLAGDGVTIEMSSYDRRRLIFRHKDDERAGVSRSLVRRPFVRPVLVDFKRTGPRWRRLSTLALEREG